MATVTAFEAKTRFGELLERVSRGEEVVITHEAASLAMSQLSDLAATYQLTLYDAAYLELAQRRQLVLGCKDGPLRKVAKRAGVELWL